MLNLQQIPSLENISKLEVLQGWSAYTNNWDANKNVEKARLFTQKLAWVGLEDSIVFSGFFPYNYKEKFWNIA